jgi:hypothetical protein
MCRFKDLRTGRTFERMVGAILASAPIMQPHLAELRSLIPLQVGKKVSFQYTAADDRGANVTWTITVSVEKYEQVTTPAGT